MNGMERDTASSEGQGWGWGPASLEVRAMGFEPLEPYSGSVSKPWRLRHLACGAEVSPCLNRLRSSVASGCLNCRNGRKAPDEPGAKLLARLKELDLEPLEPYPGGTRTCWRVKHRPCGNEAAPRVDNLLSGRAKGCPTCARRESRMPEQEQLWRGE